MDIGLHVLHGVVLIVHRTRRMVEKRNDILPRTRKDIVDTDNLVALRQGWFTRVAADETPAPAVTTIRFMSRHFPCMFGASCDMLA
jgi:hypothetical protein